MNQLHTVLVQQHLFWYFVLFLCLEGEETVAVFVKSSVRVLWTVIEKNYRSSLTSVWIVVVFFCFLLLHWLYHQISLKGKWTLLLKSTIGALSEQNLAGSKMIIMHHFFYLKHGTLIWYFKGSALFISIFKWAIL